MCVGVPVADDGANLAQRFDDSTYLLVAKVAVTLCSSILIAAYRDSHEIHRRKRADSRGYRLDRRQSG